MQQERTGRTRTRSCKHSKPKVLHFLVEAPNRALPAKFERYRPRLSLQFCFSEVQCRPPAGPRATRRRPRARGPGRLWWSLKRRMIRVHRSAHANRSSVWSVTGGASPSPSATLLRSRSRGTHRSPRLPRCATCGERRSPRSLRQLPQPKLLPQCRRRTHSRAPMAHRIWRRRHRHPRHLRRHRLPHPHQWRQHQRQLHCRHCSSCPPRPPPPPCRQHR